MGEWVKSAPLKYVSPKYSMYTPDREEGVGPPLRSDSEHSWVEKRELGLISDWRELGLQNQNPRSTE